MGTSAAPINVGKAYVWFIGTTTFTSFVHLIVQDCKTAGNA